MTDPGQDWTQASSLSPRLTSLVAANLALQDATPTIWGW